MIFIVEDDAAIRELEQYTLQSSGFQVAGFDSSEGFWAALQNQTPELVILDGMLPGEDGFAILKKLRARSAFRRLPVLMVTAKDSELDTVKGLDYGADDYLAKPFGILEFTSRVKAALRRAAPENPSGILCFETIQLDHARHRVTVEGHEVELTYKEYHLLKLLLEYKGLVVSRDQIMHSVWGTDIAVESRTIDMHIRTLRQKLGTAAGYIQTVRKAGYRLALPVEEHV